VRKHPRPPATPGPPATQHPRPRPPAHAALPTALRPAKLAAPSVRLYDLYRRRIDVQALRGEARARHVAAQHSGRKTRRTEHSGRETQPRTHLQRRQGLPVVTGSARNSTAAI